MVSAWTSNPTKRILVIAANSFRVRLCAAGFTSSQRNPRYRETVVGRSILTNQSGFVLRARAIHSAPFERSAATGLHKADSRRLARRLNDRDLIHGDLDLERRPGDPPFRDR